jgi:hypothetical protein
MSKAQDFSALLDAIESANPFQAEALAQQMASMEDPEALMPSQYEELLFKATVIRHVSIRLGIGHAELFADDELIPLIRSRNGEVATALASFLEAHQAWSDFHVRIEREDRAGNLSVSEHEELGLLIEKRDRTRNILLKLLEALPDAAIQKPPAA